MQFAQTPDQFFQPPPTHRLLLVAPALAASENICLFLVFDHVATAPRFRNGQRRRSDNRHTARLDPSDNLIRDTRRSGSVSAPSDTKQIQATAIDAGDGIFAPELRHLLGRACRIGRRRERLADATLKTYAARLNARLDELMRLAPAHEAGVKLQRMIKRTRQYLFVFVTNRDIPATNNGSERALRPCVVFRKITNGFRTEWGPSSTPTSAPSSRLPAAVRSAPSKQSVSPSRECPSRIQHS